MTAPCAESRVLVHYQTVHADIGRIRLHEASGCGVEVRPRAAHRSRADDLPDFVMELVDLASQVREMEMRRRWAEPRSGSRPGPVGAMVKATSVPSHSVTSRGRGLAKQVAHRPAAAAVIGADPSHTEHRQLPDSGQLNLFSESPRTGQVGRTPHRTRTAAALVDLRRDSVTGGRREDGHRGRAARC